MTYLYANYGIGYQQVGKYATRQKAVAMYQRLKMKTWYGNFSLVEEDNLEEWLTHHEDEMFKEDEDE